MYLKTNYLTIGAQKVQETIQISHKISLRAKLLQHRRRFLAVLINTEELYTLYYDSDSVESQFKHELEALKQSVAAIKDKQALTVLGPTKLK